MSDKGTHNLPDKLTAAVKKDISMSKRFTNTITQSIPWQFPGRLLQILTSLTPENCDKTRIQHAVVAVEYGCFHQFLHAIPQTNSQLVEPVADSAYAKNPTAAILDGDSLQASAFSRLARVTDNPTVIEQFYDSFAGASISCYEDAITSEPNFRGFELAHMAGVATHIAAEISGADSSNMQSVMEAGKALGEAVPVLTPTGWQSQGEVDTDAATRQLAKSFGDSREADRRILTALKYEKELPAQDL